MSDDTRYSTTDLDLVAFLSYQHFSCAECDMVDSMVTWFYTRNAALEREIDTFRREDALVEPKRYMAVLSRVRREMHAVFDSV